MTETPSMETGEPSRNLGTGRSHEGDVGSFWVELVRESKLEKGWLMVGMAPVMVWYFGEFS